MKGKHSKAFDESKICCSCPLPYCVFDASDRGEKGRG